MTPEAPDLAVGKSVIAAFRRTRLRALLALVPFSAAAAAGIYLFESHRDVEIAGLGPEKLVFVVFGVGALSLLAFFLVWRCPQCGASFGFQKGFALAFCHRCGAVFTDAPGGSAGNAAAQRRGQIDAAVRKDLEGYRSRLAIVLMRGLVLLAIGIAIAVFARPGDGPPKPDAVLLNRLGPHGATLAIIAIGCTLALVGLLVMAWAIRGLTSGSAHREQRTRAFLGGQPAPAEGLPRTQDVGRDRREQPDRQHAVGGEEGRVEPR